MKVQSWPQYKGEAFNYSVDWGVTVGRLSTSVSSVTWSVDGGNATISGESLTTSLASALITTSDTGCVMVKVTALLADGQIDIHYFKINVDEPNCTPSVNKY
jgi:hypothetical protein